MAEIKDECIGEDKNESESTSNGLNFDEMLAATVRRHPVLYDKSYKDFHERDVKDNAWQAVAREVGLVSGRYWKFQWEQQKFKQNILSQR